MAEHPAVEFLPLDPDREADAARLMVAALPDVSPEGAAGFFRVMAEDPGGAVHLASEEGRPVALYVLRKVGVTTELLMIAVDPAVDPARQLELAAVRDAAIRVGKRPLTVETSEQALAWYKALGFKVVGKRPRPDGTVSYRLGWHGPKPGQAAPGGAGVVEEPCPDPAELLRGRP